ncbi:MAG: hypothetical protein J0I69_15305 [Altererythrobacter sp.]|mgnify:CR=1 FL=1|nr:hypothetical protein [Altererythrobacter sp.]OJU59582.1 MAG: hypothetical protein BGO08_00995 [Altererythrobacter sp. 66-12]
MRFNHALPLLVLLAACATPADQYPSLALRDAERATGTLQAAPAEPYVPPPTPPATLGRLAQLAAQGESANQAFLKALPETRSAVAAARGVAPGGEAWARAQVALAGLGAARGEAMIALADLDRIYVDAAVNGEALEPIAAARDSLAGQVEQQDAVITELGAALR